MVDRDGNPRPLYYIVQALNGEVANLGTTLRSLSHQDTSYVPGKVLGTRNSPPSGVTNWSAGAGGDPCIINVDLDFSKEGNEGTEKNGCIGFFTDDANGRYFMLTNIYNSGDLNSTETELDFVVEFGSDVNALMHYNRLTGEEEIVALIDHKLCVTLPGGTGNLYGYDTSVPKAIAPTPYDGQTSVVPEVVLSWTAGTDANTHKVYFGPGSAPVNLVVTLPVDVTSYDPNNPANINEPNLAYDTIYYWRMDEVTGPNTYTGDVWSFTTSESGPYPYYVSLWKLDQGSGMVALDSIGSNHGSIHDATWDTGQINTALRFDGNEDYVEVPSDSSLDLTTATWSFWVKPSGDPAGSGLSPLGTGIIIGRNDSWASKNGVCISMTPYTTYGTLSAHVRDDSLASSVLTVDTVFSSSDIDYHTWSHVAFVYSSGGGAKLYINGTLAVSYTVGNFSFNNQVLRLATSLDPYFYDFNGSLDEIAIFNRAFSAEDIQQLYLDGFN